MPNPQKSFSETIKEIFELRGFNAKKIAEITDIPESHVTALINNDFKKLPAYPYVRGYLTKIAEILNIDKEELLELYKKEIPESIGEKDKLPFNRFSKQLTSRKKIILGIILLFAAIYLGFRIDDLIGVPEIKITNPSENYSITNEPIVKLSGVAENFFDKLTINDEEIPINKGGLFEKDFNLQPGQNNIEFKIKRFLGKETKVEKQVIYQP